MVDRTERDQDPDDRDGVRRNGRAPRRDSVRGDSRGGDSPRDDSLRGDSLRDDQDRAAAPTRRVALSARTAAVRRGAARTGLDDAAAGTGPYDGDAIDGATDDRTDGAPTPPHRGLTDFGSLRIPVPDGGQVDVEPASAGTMQAVHVRLGRGRLSISALAAPRTGVLWPELVAEIAASLGSGGARVRSYTGEWGRELHATSGAASSRFIGVDGPRWMLYGVATGPAEHAESLESALRRMLAGVVVLRGKAPYPVRTVLPLTVPEQLVAAADTVATRAEPPGDLRARPHPAGPAAERRADPSRPWGAPRPARPAPAGPRPLDGARQGPSVPPQAAEHHRRVGAPEQAAEHHRRVGAQEQAFGWSPQRPGLRPGGARPTPPASARPPAAHTPGPFGAPPGPVPPGSRSPRSAGPGAEHPIPGTPPVPFRDPPTVPLRHGRPVVGPPASARPGTFADDRPTTPWAPWPTRARAGAPVEPHRPVEPAHHPVEPPRRPAEQNGRSVEQSRTPGRPAAVPPTELLAVQTPAPPPGGPLDGGGRRRRPDGAAAPVTSTVGPRRNGHRYRTDDTSGSGTSGAPGDQHGDHPGARPHREHREVAPADETGPFPIIALPDPAPVEHRSGARTHHPAPPDPGRRPSASGETTGRHHLPD